MIPVILSINSARGIYSWAGMRYRRGGASQAGKCSDCAGKSELERPFILASGGYVSNYGMRTQFIASGYLTY